MAEILTINDILKRVTELKRDDFSMKPEAAVYYWLDDIGRVLINIENTSLNEADKRQRKMDLVKKLLAE